MSSTKDLPPALMQAAMDTAASCALIPANMRPLLCALDKHVKELGPVREAESMPCEAKSAESLMKEKLELLNKIAALATEMAADCALIEKVGWVIDGVRIHTSIPPLFRGQLVVSNSYETFLRDVTRRRTVIKTKDLPSFSGVLRLPDHSNSAVHQAFSDPSLIIRDDHLLFVAPDDEVLAKHVALQINSMNKPLEVIVKRWGEDRFTYVGSFQPKTWWLPFTWSVTGELDELHRGWTRSAQDGGRLEFEELRLQWPRVRNLFRFCVFECVGFNEAFVGDLEQLAVRAPHV